MDNRIGEYLKSARLSVRLTQQESAKQAGISRQQVNLIENGKSLPEWDTVERLVGVYRCSRPEAVRIFTGTSETKPHMRLALRMEEILAPAAPYKREQIVDAVAEFAERMVRISSETVPGISTEQKKTHYSVLWSPSDRTTAHLRGIVPVLLPASDSPSVATVILPI